MLKELAHHGLFFLGRHTTAEMAEGELARPCSITRARARLRMKLPMTSGRLSWG